MFFYVYLFFSHVYFFMLYFYEDKEKDRADDKVHLEKLKVAVYVHLLCFCFLLYVLNTVKPVYGLCLDYRNYY